jgi:hypothetical protein
LLLNKFIIEIFDKHAPLTTSMITKRPAPWLTDNLKVMMKIRNKAFSKYKRSKSLIDYQHYQKLRNIVTSAVRAEKSAYLNFQSIHPNKRRLYKTLRQMDMRSAQQLPHRFLIT